MSVTPIQAIIGLGNPGPEHVYTRHNAGFWLVDALADRYQGRFRAHAKYQGDVCRISVGGHDITLLKPQTYMNRSGLAVRSLCDYLKIAAHNVVIAHDELDLPIGTAKLKFAGGHGGHNGLRDTITHVGAEFWRLRLGIGHPGSKDDVIDYVLRRAPASEEQAIMQCVTRSVGAVVTMLEQGVEKAMHALHTKT